MASRPSFLASPRTTAPSLLRSISDELGGSDRRQHLEWLLQQPTCAPHMGRATDPVGNAHFMPSHVSLAPPAVSGRRVTRDGVLHWSPLATRISRLD